MGLLERDGEMWADRGLEAEAGSGAFGRWCRKDRGRGRVGEEEEEWGGEAMGGVGGGTAEINH